VGAVAVTGPDTDTDPGGAAFDQLAAEAAALDNGRRGPAPAPADPAQVAGDEAAELVELVGALALPLLPVVLPKIGAQLHAAYGPDQRAAIARALAAVAVKRGWSIGEAFGRYGPELALLAALAGPALPILLADARARKAPAPAADPVRQAETIEGDPVPDPAPADLVREYQTADDGRVK
jgi:hypothetical protein